jgi:hypothetical protein
MVALAPLIDPNVHSCGTVQPHGAEELKHPEPNFFTVGMKSYGRAPTFLTLTGYEQVRSVVAALVGDWEAARNVGLVLPETGVCSTDADAGGGRCTTTDQIAAAALVSEAELLVARHAAFRFWSASAKGRTHSRSSRRAPVALPPLKQPVARARPTTRAAAPLA